MGQVIKMYGRGCSSRIPGAEELPAICIFVFVNIDLHAGVFYLTGCKGCDRITLLFNNGVILNKKEGFVETVK